MATRRRAPIKVLNEILSNESDKVKAEVKEILPKTVTMDPSGKYHIFMPEMSVLAGRVLEFYSMGETEYQLADSNYNRSLGVDESLLRLTWSDQWLEFETGKKSTTNTISKLKLPNWIEKILNGGLL